MFPLFTSLLASFCSTKTDKSFNNINILYELYFWCYFYTNSFKYGIFLDGIPYKTSIGTWFNRYIMWAPGIRPASTTTFYFLSEYQNQRITYFYFFPIHLRKLDIIMHLLCNYIIVVGARHHKKDIIKGIWNVERDYMLHGGRVMKDDGTIFTMGWTKRKH